MAVFRYPLNHILELKLKLEKQYQTEMSLSMQALVSEKEKLKEFQTRELQSMAGFKQEVSRKQIDPKHIASLNKEVGFYHKAVHEQVLVVNKQAEDVEAKRNRVKEAVKERKMYEALKEKAYEAYLEEEKNEEMKLVDEIVSFNQFRNGKE